MATKNLFAVLDSDDEDVPVKVESQQTKDNKTSRPTTTGSAPAKKQNNRPQNNKNTPRDGQDNRERKPNQRRGDNERPRGPRPARGGEGGNSERPRSERGGRGGRRGGRRHEFDRRSGTGRGRETSKSGGGAHNWGNDKDETELVAEAELQEGQTTTASSEEEAPIEDAPEAEAEEDNEMTLDEYLAKKKESRVGDNFAAVQVRTVENEFDQSALIKKDGKTPFFIEANYEKVFTKKTSGRKKQVIKDVGFQAAPVNNFPRRGGRGGDNENRRGGRGGDNENRRGGRGGAGGRRGGRRSHAPNVADLKAFPSLA